MKTWWRVREAMSRKTCGRDHLRGQTLDKGARSEAYNIKKLTFSSIYILRSKGWRVWTAECPLWPHDRALSQSHYVKKIPCYVLSCSAKCFRKYQQKVLHTANFQASLNSDSTQRTVQIQLTSRQQILQQHLSQPDDKRERQPPVLNKHVNVISGASNFYVMQKNNNAGPESAQIGQKRAQ